jgi:hypothetical protein
MEAVVTVDMAADILPLPRIRAADRKPDHKSDQRRRRPSDVRIARLADS